MPHGVYEDDPFVLERGIRPADEGDVLLAEEVCDFVETLGMARGDKEKEVETFKGIEDLRFFRGVGACDGDGWEREFVFPERSVYGLGLEVELEIAGDVEAGRVDKR